MLTLLIMLLLLFMFSILQLEPVPFDINRDLITPTFKHKRTQLLKHYKARKPNFSLQVIIILTPNLSLRYAIILTRQNHCKYVFPVLIYKFESQIISLCRSELMSSVKRQKKQEAYIIRRACGEKCKLRA